MKDFLHVTFSNGHTYEIPISVIVEHRADYLHEKHKDEFATLEEAMRDTEDLFASDTYEIEDWAKNNMNWDAVSGNATLVDVTPANHAEEWANAAVEISGKKLNVSELLNRKKQFLSLPIEFLISYMGEKEMPVSIFSLSANSDQMMGAVITVIGPNTEFFVAAMKHANGIVNGLNEKPETETTH